MSADTIPAERYDALIDTLPDIALILDDDGRFLDVLTNDHTEDLLQADSASDHGESVFDVFPDETADRFHTAIQRAIETNTVQTREYDLAVETETRTLRVYIAPIPTEDEDRSEVICVADDATARTESERWLTRLTAIISDSERSFEETLGALFDLGCERFDLAVGAVARVDPENARLDIEYTSDEEYVPPETDLRLSEAFAASLVTDGSLPNVSASTGDEADKPPALAERGIDTYLGTYIDIEGDRDRVLFFASPDTRTTPSPPGEHHLLELMGQWLKYERERNIREQRERRIEAIFDQTYQFTGLLEPDGTLVEANQTALEFGGLDRGEVVGQKMWDAYWFHHSEETRARAREAVQRAADGEFVRHELPVQGADREAIIDFSIRPITDETGEVTLLVPEGRDITERKRHENRLEALNDATRKLWQAESEQDIAETIVESVEAVLDEHLVAVWTYDGKELVPLAASDGARTLGNVQASEGDLGAIPPGTREMQAFHRNDVTIIDDYQTVEEPAHPETPLRTLVLAPLGEYGQIHVGSMSSEEFDDATVELVEVLAKNAEAAFERQAREADLKRSRDRLARTEQLASVGGWELDLESESVSWTDGTRRIHETSPEYDPDLEDGIEFYHPDDRDRVREAIEQCRTAGDPYNIEARLLTAEGHERWVEATGAAVEEDGEIVRLEGAIRDITARKRREQQLSVLYRILRHNLRNDLNVIRGFADAIGDDLDRIDAIENLDDDEVETFDHLVAELSDPPETLDADIERLRQVLETASEFSIDETQEYVHRIRHASEDLMSIGNKANQLQGVITDETTNTQTCQVDSTIETVASDIHREFPEATINTTDVENHTVAAAPEKLSIALRELLKNAIEHAEHDETTVTLRTDTTQDGYVRIDVIDEGPGIPTQELEVLQKEQEDALLHGSGIGLWVVNWLASYMDGQLSFDSTATGGTTVTIAIPAGDGAPSDQSPELIDGTQTDSAAMDDRAGIARDE